MLSNASKSLAIADVNFLHNATKRFATTDETASLGYTRASMACFHVSITLNRNHNICQLFASMELESNRPSTTKVFGDCRHYHGFQACGGRTASETESIR
jgi:hypothetical protein